MELVLSARSSIISKHIEDVIRREISVAAEEPLEITQLRVWRMLMAISSGFGSSSAGITFPARGRLEARRCRSNLAQGIALGWRRKIDPEAA
jgi:hypothetical protein